MSEPTLRISDSDRSMLAGECGPAAEFAMQLVVRTAEITGAESLVDISWAHVTSAYYNGQANLDLAERLADLGAQVSVPTTLTACSLDFRQAGRDSAAPSVRSALRLIELYRDMGCDTVMTCAPYHTRGEPAFGEHLAWTESSAVVYANSVLGARSNRYYEFFDICAAITGRVPYTGLHEPGNRAATVLVSLAGLPPRWLDDDCFYHILGFLLGRSVGNRIAAIEGLPLSVTAEQLRAIGTAANASGSVDMLHAIGLTPEAATRREAFHGKAPQETLCIDREAIRNTVKTLDTSSDLPLTAVCVGAPHFSIAEFDRLLTIIEGRTVHPDVHFYITTSRHVLDELKERGWLYTLQAAGIELITDRCSYYPPAIEGCTGRVMTNSAKWAYYAPSMLGSAVTFAGLDDCVASAVAGEALRVSWF